MFHHISQKSLYHLGKSICLVLAICSGLLSCNKFAPHDCILHLLLLLSVLKLFQLFHLLLIEQSYSEHHVTHSGVLLNLHLNCIQPIQVIHLLLHLADWDYFQRPTDSYWSHATFIDNFCATFAHHNNTSSDVFGWSSSNLSSILSTTTWFRSPIPFWKGHFSPAVNNFTPSALQTSYISSAFNSPPFLVSMPLMRTKPAPIECLIIQSIASITILLEISTEIVSLVNMSSYAGCIFFSTISNLWPRCHQSSLPLVGSLKGDKVFS